MDCSLACPVTASIVPKAPAILVLVPVIGRFRETLMQYQAGPLANYMPCTPNTECLLAKLAALKPKTLAAMHGSSYVGDGEKALLDLGPVLKELLGSAE